MAVRRKTAAYTIDNIRYKSKSLVDIHKELKENKYVKSFTLPHIGDKQKKSKYGAYKAEVNGIIFDSVMEARYFAYLLLLKAKKEIKDFSCQVKFNLLPKGRNKFTGKAILETNYIADFVIVYPDDRKVVVDIKGKKTIEFRLKEKMFFFKYPDLELKCVQWDAKTHSWRDLNDILADKRKRTVANKNK